MLRQPSLTGFSAELLRVSITVQPLTITSRHEQSDSSTSLLLISLSVSSQVFLQSSLPVIQHYEALGKVHRIYADRSPDEVYQEVRKLFL